MSDRFEMVPFEDRQIMTVRGNDGIHVVMKPVAEALGLDWAAQRRRIANHPVLSKGMALKAIPSAGGMQEVVTLDLEKFHGWVVTLTPDRITDEEKRTVIIRYQERAFRVIFEHFHGRMGQRLNLQSVTSRVSLQNQALRLVRKLQVTRNRVERQMMYEMLEGMCTELGINTPALDQLGHDAPQPPDILRTFWDALDTLKARGVEFNHSRAPHILAVSLVELGQHFKNTGIRIEIDTLLKRAIRQSEAPRFIANTTVNSRLTRRAKACWVFAREA